MIIKFTPLVAAFTITPLLHAQNPMSDPKNSGSWHLNASVSDEFNGLSLDHDKFLNYLALQFFDNGEMQKDVEHRPDTLFVPENAQVADGKLSLTVKMDGPSWADGPPRKYSLPAISTRRLMRNGYFEVRAKAAAAAMNSAFWLNKQHTYVLQPLSSPWRLGPYQYGNEIDIFEILGNSTALNVDWSRRHNMNCLVYGDLNPKPTGVFTDVTSREGHTEYDLSKDAPSFTNTWHVFGFEWDDRRLQWYVDGKLKRSTTSASYADVLHQYNAPGQERQGSQRRFAGTRFATHTFRFPLQAILNVDYLPDWHGPARDTDFPATMTVDFLRIWQKLGTGKELVENGTFDSTKAWLPLYLTRDADAAVNFANHAANITISKSGSHGGSIVLTQQDITLVPATSYSLNYTAHATRPHWFTTKVTGPDGFAFAQYPECAPQDGNLGNGHIAFYSHTFTTPKIPATQTARIQFHVGGPDDNAQPQKARTLVIDNVSIRAIKESP